LLACPMPRLLPLDPATSRKTVAAIRCAQAVTWVSPRLAARAVRSPNAGELQRDYWMRLFASRAVAVGVVGLSGSPEQRAAGVRLSAGVDVADIAAAALAIKQRQLPAKVGLAYLLTGVLTLALNLNALEE
jgi:hypothetical protein